MKPSLAVRKGLRERNPVEVGNCPATVSLCGKSGTLSGSETKPFEGRKRLSVGRNYSEETDAAGAARGKSKRLFRRTIAGVFAALSLVLAVTAPAVAEERVKVEEVVVTASRIAEPAGETTSPVVVIDNEEIERMNVQFVADVLRQVTDLNLVQNGGPGKAAAVVLRGGSAEHTLVMIDGVKVKSTTTGQFDFSGIMVEDIERIEIVKGPQSTMYGSEAMAGVINIITKKGREGFNASLSYEYGAHETSEPVLSVSGGGTSYDYRLTGSYLETEGISALKIGTERDGYKNASVSGKVGLAVSENVSLEFTGRYYDDRSEVDGFDPLTFLPADDPNYVQNGRHYLLSAKVSAYLADKWEQVLTASTVEDDLSSSDPDTPENIFEINTGIDTVDWQHNLYLSENNTATLGAEYREESGENKGVFHERIDNKAVYLHIRRKEMQRLTLSAGVRHDMHETFGDETTYRFAALDEVTEGVRFRVSYATGFRAPTLNELFYQDAWGSIGNPNLKPEKSASWEIGVEQDYTDNSTIAVTYFEQAYDDLIQWEQGPPGTWQPVNVAEAKVKGVEAGAGYRPMDGLFLNVAYTYLDTEDEATGDRLPRRPEDKLKLAADYISGGLSLHADYIHVGKRLDTPGGRNLSAYDVVNISGSYGIGKHVTLFGRVENLFDEDYEEAGGFSTPGASVYGGIKLVL